MLVHYIIGVFILFSVVTGQYYREPVLAVCQLSDPSGGPVRGEIFLHQETNSDVVHVWGKIRGLTRGLHGFHVHEIGDFGNNCSNAKGHFNPFNRNHGAPYDSPHQRHVGDLGNIRANNWGRARVDIRDNQISLVGQSRLIMGRSIVVHAKRDDLGRGGDTGSQTTGNAGGRVACCKIKPYHFYMF